MKMDDAINTIEGLMKNIQTNGHGTPEEGDMLVKQENPEV